MQNNNILNELLFFHRWIVRRELGRNELIHWVGKPEPKKKKIDYTQVFEHIKGVSLCVFLIGLLWYFKDDNPESLDAYCYLAFKITCLVGGICFLFLWWWEKFLKMKEIYIITEKRAIVFGVMRKPKSFYGCHFSDADIVKREDGFGDIIFEKWYNSNINKDFFQIVGFRNISDLDKAISYLKKLPYDSGD